MLGIAADGGPDASWRGDPGLAGGGAMLDMGYHAVDLVVGLLGVPDRVYAVMHPRQRPQGGGAVEQRGTVFLEFQEDCVATLLVGRHLVPKAERFSLSTDECTYEYEEGLGLRREGRDQGTRVAVAEKPEDLRHKQLHEFVRHARGLPSLAVTFDDSMPTMVTLDACYASARTRVPVAPRWPEGDVGPRTGSRPPHPVGDADAQSPG
ncbi:MAG: Gfo/Idh/MocA family oxidoreductase [Actinomycetota bacterium]|nr:Gfo/Idh/MocA family oxidoreductase [Actinomycetota bacterium]